MPSLPAEDGGRELKVTYPQNRRSVYESHMLPNIGGQSVGSVNHNVTKNNDTDL